MKLFKYIITLLFLTSLTFLYSKDYRMQYIDATAGLPQADVKSIAQDNNGFLWISTNDGLARYDGYEFKNYSVIKEGIPTSLTRTLKCDALGNLWIGTLDRGLFVYDSSLERFDNISQKLPQDVNNKHLFIYDIAINKIDNSIWITQEFGLVYRIEYSGEGDKRQYQIKHYAIPELDKQRTNSSSLMVDSLGRTIIVKTNKAYIYNQHNDSFEALLPKTINHIAQLKIGGDRLYYIKYGRLHSSLFDGTEARLESTLAIKYFLRGDNGVLWLFTNDGIYYKSSTESEHHKISDTAHVVLCSKEDSQGNMWVGLLRKGLLAIMDDKAPFMHYAENQSAETIFENTQKDIIVGSIGGELNLLTPDTLGRYSCHNIDIKQSNQNIFAIGENHLRDEYIVCRSGIAYAIKRDDIIANNTSTAPHTKIESAESIRSITFDSTYVWLGSYAHGLMLYDAQEYKLISCFTDVSPQLKLPSNIVRNTLLDRDNNLWVATSKGLVRIAAEQRFSDSPQYKIYQHDKDDPSSISYDYIIPIAQDTKGRIWIGTLGGGVNCLTFDRDDKIIENVIYTTQNGLSNNSIKGIVIDNQDMVWVTTNRGVNRIDPQTKKVKLYTPRHGLQSYEFSELSAIKLSDGRIALGGVNGLNIFDPQDIVENNQPTPITITSFTLLNKPIKPGELFYGEEILQHTIAQSHELELKYKFNSFAFEFLSINLTNPQSVKYSYMLEGFDHQWNTTPWNNRIARYTNIPPGEYTFKVRSQNSDGEWSQSAEIKIRVQYPPLLSPIAFIVYALLLIASIFLVIWEIRRRQREKTKIILMQQEKQQLRELSQMKLNFFTNISHEFRTPLTLIITPLQLLRSGANIGKEKRDRYLDVIAYNSNILYNLITEFLNMAKSDKDNFDINLRQIDVVALTKRAFMQFETWTQQQSITADLDLPSKVIMAMADPIKLEEIIYNLLSNAIKYTPTNGRIHLSLHEESDNFISVSISNSGEGISPEKQSHIFERYFTASDNGDGVGIGLSLTKNLVELHGGELSFTSNRECTTFTFTIPVGDIITSEKPQLPSSKETSFAPSPTHINKSYNCKILIVDDNQTIVSLLEDLLSPTYTIIKAYNAEEAYEVAQKSLPSLIISDVRMNGLSGVELCRQLKESEKTSHIPIILLTANASKESQMEGIQTQADAYIIKPFDNDILLGQIQSLLANRESIVAKFNLSGSGELASLYQRDEDQEFVNQVIKVIEDNISNPDLSVEMLSTKLGIHKVTLNKRLKKVVDKTANSFIRSVRMKYAAAMLVNGNYTIAETTYAIGLNDLRHFRECFKREYGVLPSEYAASTPMNDNEQA